MSYRLGRLKDRVRRNSFLCPLGLCGRLAGMREGKGGERVEGTSLQFPGPLLVSVSDWDPELPCTWLTHTCVSKGEGRKFSEHSTQLKNTRGQSCFSISKSDDWLKRKLKISLARSLFYHPEETPWPKQLSSNHSREHGAMHDLEHPNEEGRWLAWTFGTSYPASDAFFQQGQTYMSLWELFFS